MILKHMFGCVMLDAGKKSGEKNTARKHGVTKADLILSAVIVVTAAAAFLFFRAGSRQGA